MFCHRMIYIIFLAIISCTLAVQVENEALKEFISGNHKFAAAVYKGILKRDSGSFVSSPLSVEIILALTNEGAKGETSDEIVRGLSLPDSKEKIRTAVKSLISNLKTPEEEVKLLSANKIYVADDVKLENGFNLIATDIYGSGVENIDFSNNKEASATISTWVEENTNYKIQDLIKPSDIQNTTKMVLVNTLYFRGRWSSKFELGSTKKEKFFKTKVDAIEVDTMQQIDFFNYYENPSLNAKFLKLPYKGDGDVSMVIVLPNEIEGLTQLEENMEQVLAPQPFIEEFVDIFLPRFNVETEVKFVPILNELGIRKLFSGGDLSGISSTDRNLGVSEVIQKAFINVTEAGTDAAAATAEWLLGAANSPDIKMFNADHPFLYYIDVNGVIAFCGRYIG